MTEFDTYGRPLEGVNFVCIKCEESQVKAFELSFQGGSKDVGSRRKKAVKLLAIEFKPPDPNVFMVVWIKKEDGANINLPYEIDCDDKTAKLIKPL